MAAKRKPKILIVDDEEDIRASLRMILEYEGMSVVEADSGKSGLEALDRADPDVVLLDIKMPRMDGLEVLSEIRSSRSDLPVVMISGHGTVATAVEATKLGAFDFMEKPLERDRVLLVLRNAMQQRQLAKENRDLRLAFEERYRMIGDSPALREVQEIIARAAPTKASVLIIGESGTGKELVARAIHSNSQRAEAAFVKVNCAAIPEELIESELFGHLRGSFTGATKDQVGKFVRADGGTIFLDEIGDMSMKTQAKVLRVLQDGEVEPVGAAKTLNVDVRVIAATNKNLTDEIDEHRFREDLFFRLNVVPVSIPPLRERRGDIDALVDYFSEIFSVENGFKPKTFSDGAREAMRRAPWRGNVRELRNAVERLLILAPGDTVDAEHIPAGLGMALDDAAGRVADGVLALPYREITLQDFKDRAERAYLVARLNDNEWNVAATAKAIETPRSNLYKKLDAYEISRDES